MRQPVENLDVAFARLQHGLRSYLRKRLRDPTQADDLLHDVFVKALATQRAGRRVENLTGWLYAAARTTLIDHYRATGTPMEPLDDNMPNTETDDLQLHQELSLCLKAFVERLAPIYRDTLIANEFQGEALRSMAEKHKVSVSAIKSRAARARAMLRDALLTCCHVEVVDGMVSDFHRISPTKGSGKCT